jgi:hypothetical protein
MQEIINEMEQLRINMASIMEKKENYIFIAATQKKTRRREESLYYSTEHNITNWLCVDERIITANSNILKTVCGPNGDESITNKDFFYENVQRAVTDCGNSRELVVIGDCNGGGSNRNIV